MRRAYKNDAGISVRYQKVKKDHIRLRLGIFLALAMLLLLGALFARQLCPYDPNLQDYSNALQPPSLAHPFGTDRFGRDMLSRVIMGGQVSIFSTLILVAVITVFGTGVGVVCGYAGGLTDGVIMRICDVLFAFPGILLAIAVVAVLGSGIANVIIAVAIFSIPAFARLVRGNTLVLKQQTFIESARSIGASDMTILLRHILPGTVSSIVVFFTMRIGTSIISAASLSFLGLGAQPPTPEWGAMLNEARADMVIAPHVAVFPALAIFLTVLAFNLLGDGLRDALDPKIKG